MNLDRLDYYIEANVSGRWWWW